MKKILLAYLLCFAVQAKDMEKFFAAMAKVESSNNPNAVNRKENALGLYQIRPLYFADSGIKTGHKSVFSPTIARKVVEAYFMRYEPTALRNGDFETLARCHNGGPNWRKHKSKTDVYWQKIKRNL